MAKKSSGTVSSNKKKESGNLTTGEFRLSFPYLFQKSQPLAGGGEGKYRLTMLFKKSDKGALQAIEKILYDACMSFEKWNDKQKKDVWTKTRNSIFQNGDDKDYDGYAGMIAVNASNSRKPGVVGPDLSPIIDREEVYGGCYGRAAVRAFAYDNVSKGVALSLQGFQKTRDGEPFGNKFSAEDSFDAVETDEESF